MGGFVIRKTRSLLDIFVEVKKKRPNSDLLLVGEGELREMLKQKAQKLGIADSVIFYGTSQNIERLLCVMDVFVFPSRFEGLGIVAVEAQAAGLHVICSEHIPQETCVTDLFKRLPLDFGAAKWAETLLSIRTDPLTRKEYPEKVKNAGFDISNVVAQIECCYMRS